MAIKNFHIGQMRQSVTFEDNSPGAAGAGQQDNYTDGVTTRARLRKMSGSRTLGFGEIDNSEQYELICRVQQDLEDKLAIDTKVLYLNQEFTISSWEKIDLQKPYYRMILKLQRQTSIV